MILSPHTGAIQRLPFQISIGNTQSLSVFWSSFQMRWFTIKKTLLNFIFPRHKQVHTFALVHQIEISTDHSPAETVLTCIFLTDASSYTKYIRSTFDFHPSILLSKAEKRTVGWCTISLSSVSVYCKSQL